MVTLARKVTTVIEIKNNIQIRIEGLLTNGFTVADGATLELRPDTDQIEVVLKHEIAKQNCEDEFQKHLDRTLATLNTQE